MDEDAMATMDWPLRLWLIRHGQSAGNVARDAAEESGADLIDLDTRDADVPLSDLGTVQSQATAQWFADLEQTPEVFFTSPFVRAYQTCKAVAQDDEICLDERLREKEFGILDRFTKRGIINKFPELAEQRRLVGKFYFRPPGGESWCDVILRLRSFVEVLRRDYAQRRVVVVSHQVIVNCLRYLLERLDERRILDIDQQGDVPNCSITEYAGTPDGMMLVNANFTGHLEQASAPITRASDKPAGPK
jgi:broad specificity phosphatase PhoE